MTLEQVAQTAISASLWALEDEDDGALPEEMVRAKLLRVYARCLGLNPDNGCK